MADNEVIGVGTVVARTEKVHKNQLLSNETKVMINELVCNGQPHPTYTNYNLEVGSFTAWLTSELELHELS